MKIKLNVFQNTKEKYKLKMIREKLLDMGRVSESREELKTSKAQERSQK